MTNYPQPIKEALESSGFQTRRDDSSARFVLTIIFNNTRSQAVGLLKQKGPTFLRGKVTFPGGQVEPQDTSLELRCSAEAEEEANALVLPDDWRFVAQSNAVAVFTAALPSLSGIRTMELEPVFVFDVAMQLELAAAGNSYFAQDFGPLLNAAKWLHDQS